MASRTSSPNKASVTDNMQMNTPLFDYSVALISINACVCGLLTPHISTFCLEVKATSCLQAEVLSYDLSMSVHYETLISNFCESDVLRQITGSLIPHS